MLVELMRHILRKLEYGKNLNTDEYQILLEYADRLKSTSIESYALFHEKYAGILYQEYSTFLPLFDRGIDDLIDYLLSRPELFANLGDGPLPLQLFPAELRAYLHYTYGSDLDRQYLQSILRMIKASVSITEELPSPRNNEIVYKYEDSNPYKEIGLKKHFDRLARYSFISRLQTYRYLTRAKAQEDRIEYLKPDRLGGIFTNKEKSIYYYIFLSEADSKKAQNACRLLNIVFYA
jgi:hypothetical protein